MLFEATLVFEWDMAPTLASSVVALSEELISATVGYIERNALRANLAPGSQRWRWGSLHRWKLRYGEGKGVVGGLALAALAGLGRARQRTANRGGVGGAASLRGTRQSVRRGSLVRPDHPTTGTGKHALPSRPPQKARKRFLTPSFRVEATRSRRRIRDWRPGFRHPHESRPPACG